MANENLSDQTRRTNVPELSVSELAFSLKKTLEDSYGHVRIRGELSRVKIHTSGHMYSDLKDDNAVINVVCWKGTVAKLSVRPEEGLEVICTGRITTYPARSNYQLVIESMELAGEGALLKMLEERKKKLAAEGLFSPERKKKLPFLPQKIGVITSPTGAVIRDIMHRLNDRFPRHVLLWPVLVQGPGAAEQIAAAINGFNALQPPHRPDLLIVARGGGSLEDLMAFNEEAVVRAAVACTIPLISAVGHETDTTLIDYAADRRAPTPTGAAEMAVPRRIDLLAQVTEDEQRLIGSIARLSNTLRDKLDHIAARLGDPHRLLEIKTQKLDHLAQTLSHGFTAGLQAKQSRLKESAAALRHPRSLIAEKTRMLAFRTEALERLAPKLVSEPQRRLDTAARMLQSLSFEAVLQRGFVVVRDQDGTPLTAAGQTRTGQNVQLQFRDGHYVDALIGPGSKNPEKPGETAAPPKDQGQLF
ncbi:MAG: exodeoxyribonuclease VII large subunit [Rhodospirillales bacterium]|nr:exodeoxyribonuclease VII large subunit [Rhodospirillales bacterium]MCB9996150.1 exodeoxyribonuclease VII large subunit [Rhodospirillales bacterium]